MINLNIILEAVPNHMLIDLAYEFEDVQESYCVTTDATINPQLGHICLDLENDAQSIAVALMNSLDMLDDMGLSPYITEMGVIK